MSQADVMPCGVCGTDSPRVFSATIRRRYEAGFFQCGWCGFLQTEEPYWLPEAYREAIGSHDTGLLSRSHVLAETVGALLYALFHRDGTFVDYGGGYGVLVRLMRDRGFDFRWDDRYAENLFARGFEYDWDAPVEAMTAFEVFEHLPRPREDIERMLSRTRTILFSTLLLPNPVPKPEDWWYYALERGTHVAFYSRESLSRIARDHGLQFCSNGRDLHLFSDRPVNERAFKFLIRIAKYGFGTYVKHRMTSRTASDHAFLTRGRDQSR